MRELLRRLHALLRAGHPAGDPSEDPVRSFNARREQRLDRLHACLDFAAQALRDAERQQWIGHALEARQLYENRSVIYSLNALAEALAVLVEEPWTPRS